MLNSILTKSKTPHFTVAPSPPVGPMVASDVNRRGFRVTWKPSERDGGSPITGYVVEKREAWKSTYLPVEKVPAKVLSCDLTFLIENQDYMVRVMAENIVGQSEPLESVDPITAKSPYCE